MSLVGIIDYHCGNIRSVQEAMEYLGYTVKICKTGDDLNDTTHIILPGVGAFHKAMENITKLNLSKPIKQNIEKNKPFLGICVGMQILMEQGEEFGIHKGLGIFKGKCIDLSETSNKIKTPHIGWETIRLDKKSHFFNAIDNKQLYFNHSFACITKNQDVSKGHIDGENWNVLLEHKNLIGIQCHPEKSHLAGLEFLKTFMELEYNGQ